MNLAIVASVLGLLGTWFAWRYNIKRRLNAELDSINRQIEKIEADMTYPGQIKVNVIRETRAIEYAR